VAVQQAALLRVLAVLLLLLLLLAEALAVLC
jgi:hypothetical protein